MCRYKRIARRDVSRRPRRLLRCPYIKDVRVRRQDTASTKRRLGGDVTIDSDLRWEPTIGQNPALLMINRFIPWSDFVSDSTIKTNLNTAIDARIDTARAAQEAIWTDIGQKRAGNPRCPPGQREQDSGF